MIDTHCHIDDPQYAEGLETFLANQRESGVEAILVPGVDKTSVENVLAVCDRYPGYLFPALGLHPENVKEDWREQLASIKAAVDTSFASTPYTLHPTPRRRRLIAIGEIGLDYHWDVTFKEQQHEALREQMRWAEQYNLPVMIHSRDATEDTLNILREFPTVKGVMHCFSETEEYMHKFIGLGFYISFAGNITFKKTDKTLLNSLPIDKILVETDCPYLSPTPFRGKRNESAYVYYTALEIANLRGITLEELDLATTTNAQNLFRI